MRCLVHEYVNRQLRLRPTTVKRSTTASGYCHTKRSTTYSGYCHTKRSTTYSGYCHTKHSATDSGYCHTQLAVIKSCVRVWLTVSVTPQFMFEEDQGNVVNWTKQVQNQNKIKIIKIIIIAVISTAPFHNDKGEHIALYKINNDVHTKTSKVFNYIVIM